MIDNQDQVERLLRNLTEVLPLSALATPGLMADLRERPSAAKITWDCKVIDVFYTGDEGGFLTRKKNSKCSSCQLPTLFLIAGSRLRAR